MDARPPLARASSAWPRTLILVATLALLCLAALATHAPTTHASGFTPIWVTPKAIEPGMQVSVTVLVLAVPSAPIPLRLYATLQQVGNQQCPGAQAVPGLPTLTITPPNNWAKATFTWPSQLGVGTWWFCTIDTKTNSLFSVSDFDEALLVATTFPTPTPVPAVTLEGTTSTVPAGATLTFDITNLDPTQQLVYAIVVADQGPNAEKLSGPTLVARAVSPTSSHTLVVAVTLNQGLAPGIYHLEFNTTQSNTLATPSFTIVAAVPTATPVALSIAAPQQQPGSGPPLAAYILIAALLLAAAPITVTAIRRPRA
jgi:hypothetical protein